MTLHAIAEPNWQLMAIAMGMGMILAGVATLALPDLASGLMALVAVAITGLTPYAARFERARLHSPSQRSLLAAVLIGLPMLTFGAALAHWTATSAAEWENSIGILVIVSSLSSIILNRRISSVVIATVSLWTGVALASDTGASLYSLLIGGLVGVFVSVRQARADARLAERAAEVPEDAWRRWEKRTLLSELDHHWKEHLATLDALRQAVFLRAYAQKQPINEYKQEAFALFERMLETLREDVTSILVKSELRIAEPPPPPKLPDLPDFLTGHIDPLTGLDDSNDGDGSENREALFGSLAGSPEAAAGPGGHFVDNPYKDQDISRNAPCPCGSGNKYKHCHGAMG